MLPRLFEDDIGLSRQRDEHVLEVDAPENQAEDGRDEVVDDGVDDFLRELSAICFYLLCLTISRVNTIAYLLN